LTSHLPLATMHGAIDIRAPIGRCIGSYVAKTKYYASNGSILHFVSPFRFIQLLLEILYVLFQNILVVLFAPPPPKSLKGLKKPRGRIAVVGAGLTGISSAAHAISHGFEVVIFEMGDRPGGIWSHVNVTSGLQLNSFIYRFHPAVVWSRAFPHRDEILGQIEKVWKLYGLESRTRFKTKVTKVVRADPKAKNDDPNTQSRWLVNDEPEPFDAVIVTIGACGDPKRAHFPGMPGSHRTNGKSYADALQDSDSSSREDGGGPHEGEKSTFTGVIIHSSELDRIELEGKTIVVIGSGASGVEAVETALEKKAKKAIFIARSDKWIIPRNIIVDTFLAAQPFGRQMPLSFLWEDFLKFWQYRHTTDLVPAHTRIFEGTPIVNDEFLVHVREGRCEYVRGDTQRLTQDSVVVNVRDRDSKPGDQGKKKSFKADVVVLATGFEQPTIDFLPEDLFPDDFKRPNLYLQNFSTEDWSILMTNSSYVNGIGTVGHIHIGFYTRILLVLLMDVYARPSKKDMKLWVDVVRFMKQGARGGALGFFTYMELTIWILVFHILRPDRLRWLFFIMLGWGVLEQN